MVIRAATAAVGEVVDMEAEPPGAIQEDMGETKGAGMMDTEMEGAMTDTEVADIINMKRFVKMIFYLYLNLNIFYFRVETFSSFLLHF